MPTVLQPVLGTFGSYSPHLSALDIAIHLLLALLATLLFRLFRFTWPQTLLSLLIGGYVSFFGDPNPVLHAISCVSALGAIVMSGYLFVTRKKEPKPAGGHLSTALTWAAVIFVYVLLAYAIARTIGIERWKKQVVENGMGTTVRELDLTSSTTGETRRIRFGEVSVAVPSRGLTTVTNLNGMMLKAAYDRGYAWSLRHPEKMCNLLESIRKDNDTGFPLWWFVSGLTAEEFYTELIAVHPTYLRPFQSIWTSSRLRFFLILQGILLNPSAIASFEHGGYSGFQFGSPEKDEHCELIFFDDSDDAYQVFFHASKEKLHYVDQETMNEVIKSFRVEPENDTSPTK